MGIVILKMDQNGFILNWTTYAKHMQDMFRNMLKSEAFTDVTLVCDDKQSLKVHKVVLSACSPFFKNIVEEHSSSVIYLKGIQKPTMESILEFIYMGSTKVLQETIDEFLEIAKNLEIKGISKEEEFETHFETNTDTIKVNLNVTDNTEPVLVNSYNEDVSLKIESKSNQDTDQKEKYIQFVKDSLECPICKKLLTSKSSVKSHYNSIHLGVKFDCDQCEHQATSKCNLNKHIRIVHDGIRYPCDQCDYQGTRKLNLRNHIQIKHPIN